MKIYCIEKLGGEIFGWLRKPMRKAGFDVKWFPWWITPKLPDGCILVGHSLGGGKAIRMVNEGLVKPKFLLTFDPRLEPVGGFSVPKEIYASNFYQMGFMRGYTVKNADNTLIRGYRHTEIPASFPVTDYMRNIFNQTFPST